MNDSFWASRSKLCERPAISGMPWVTLVEIEVVSWPSAIWTISAASTTLQRWHCGNMARLT